MPAVAAARMQREYEEEVLPMAEETKEAAAAVAKEAINAPWGPIDPGAAPTADEKLWGMLANLTCLVFFGPLVIFLMKGATSKFIKFNALQMLIIQAICIGICLIMQIVTMVLLATVPFLAMLLVTVFSLVGLAMLVAVIVLSIKAWNGVVFRAPGIGQIAYTKAYSA
jgi:uncharacterized membrane protein